MKRLFNRNAALVGLCAVLFVAVINARVIYRVFAGPNTWYVATTGSDTTGNGSSGNPWQHVYFAVANASVVNGDTINLAHGTYAGENSGSNYLNVSKQLTVQTDPNDLVNGKAVIQAPAAGTRVVNVGASNTTLNNLVIDSTGQTTSNAVVVQAVTGVSITNCDIRDVPGSGAGINMSGASGAVTADKCTFTNSAPGNNGTSTNFVATAGTGESITLKGVTVSGVNAAILPTSGINQTLFRTLASADGTRNTITGCAYGVRFPVAATLATADIEACDFSSLTHPPITDNQITTATVSSLTVKSCSSTAAQDFIQLYGTYPSSEIAYNSVVSSKRFLLTENIGFANSLIHNNYGSFTSSTSDVISLYAGGSGIQIYNNAFTSDTTTHMFCIGADGGQVTESNTGTATSSLNLGDTSAHTYLAQTFTFQASTAVPNDPKLMALTVKMKKTGSPDGTVTCYLYSDSTSAPGSLVDTSELAMPASGQTGTTQWVQFFFPNHPSMSYSTAYWIVLKYNGTIDGSNYITLDSNTGTTTTQTSANGTAWSPGSLNVTLLYQVQTAAYSMVNPVVYGNTLTATNASSAPHGILIGGTMGGKMYGNLIGTSAGGANFIGMIFKLADGSGANTSLAYDNLIYAKNGSQFRGIYDKGSRTALYYQNTIIGNGAGYPTVLIGQDYGTSFTPIYNGQASQNATVENNIIYNPDASGPLYQLGGTQTTTVGCTGVTIDYNLIYTHNSTVIAWDYRTGSQVIDNYAQWQASGFDAHGKNADPRLSNTSTTSRAVDFVPASNSPAAFLGVNLGGVVTTDYYGNAFSFYPVAGAIIPYAYIPRVVSPSRTASPTRTVSPARTSTSR